MNVLATNQGHRMCACTKSKAPAKSQPEAASTAPATEQFVASEPAPALIQPRTRAEKMNYVTELLGKPMARPAVNLYDSLAAAQADGQLRGAAEGAEFTEFTKSLANQPEEFTPREAAFEAAMTSYPGSDHQNLFRFVEAEF